MRPVKILVFIACCFASAFTFAQSPNTIEADLLRSFKRIGYWDERKSSNKEGYDSLQKANDVFSKKLKSYTEKHAFTLNEPLTLLKKERLDIFTSSDGLFRIYSWDTWQGGTMHAYSDVIQFKAGQKTHSKLFTNEDFAPSYSNLYTFKTSDKTYYLAVYGGSESTRYFYAGIKAFTIENGQLKENVRVIKTRSGLQNSIQYEFDFSFNNSWDEVPQPTFDATAKTIRIPLVNENGKITRKFITYKFTGQYFEKVKS